MKEDERNWFEKQRDNLGAAWDNPREAASGAFKGSFRDGKALGSGLPVQGVVVSGLNDLLASASPAYDHYMNGEMTPAEQGGHLGAQVLGAAVPSTWGAKALANGSRVLRSLDNVSSLGPRVGGGARLENLSAGEIARIQNAANRTGTRVTVVGSRANGTPRANSDWDYVLPSNTLGKTRHSLRSSLPEGPRNIGEPRNQDFFLDGIDPTKPHITFEPGLE